MGTAYRVDGVTGSIYREYPEIPRYLQLASSAKTELIRLALKKANRLNSKIL
jgi:hypothetical protein